MVGSKNAPVVLLNNLTWSDSLLSLVNSKTAVYSVTDSVGERAGGGGSGPSNPRMYDQVYFDSDSDEEDTPSKSAACQQINAS